MFTERKIKAKVFALYLGKESYIDFGNQTTDENVTWINIVKQEYWSLPIEAGSIKYGDIALPFPSAPYAILDSGTSLIGWPKTDFDNMIDTIAQGAKTYYFYDVGYYGIVCDSIEDMKNMTITIEGHVTTLQPESYIIHQHQFCLFLIFPIELSSIILGDSYL
jgi:hypothetical protein